MLCIIFIFGTPFGSNNWSRSDATFMICSIGMAEYNVLIMTIHISNIKISLPTNWCGKFFISFVYILKYHNFSFDLEYIFKLNS